MEKKRKMSLIGFFIYHGGKKNENPVNNETSVRIVFYDLRR